MSDRIRADMAARAFLTLGALLPYWRLLTFGVVYVTDDYFASDIFNGELPGRVLVGQLIRHGQWPVWTNQLCSGIPIAGTPADPIGLAAFTLLSPAAALDGVVIALLLVAAHGAYGSRQTIRRRTDWSRACGPCVRRIRLHRLSAETPVHRLHRRLAAGRTDAARSGAGSPGRIRPDAGDRAPRLFIGLFGLVFAVQALAGFPQSVYICALVYGAFALFRAISGRAQFGGWWAPAWIVGGIGLATALGGAAGAVVLMPLSALGSVSDRAEALGWVWSSRLAYWPSNVLTFFMPYINGDISDNTYVGPPFFWEDYGYVGLATVLLAIYGAWRERRRPLIGFSIVMTIVAYLLVLGPATPVFRVAYQLVPGMKLFRFPTRFLIVVELGLAPPGCRGLTRLRAGSGAPLEGALAGPRLSRSAICAGTAADLWFISRGRIRWCQRPRVARAASQRGGVRADSPQPRTFTPRHRELHRLAFLPPPAGKTRPVLRIARRPGAQYRRGILEHTVRGLLRRDPPRWHIDVWGDHNREQSLMAALAQIDFTGRSPPDPPGARQGAENLRCHSRAQPLRAGRDRTRIREP